MAGRAPRIFVSAGEPSGDLHGGHLARALLARFPGAAIEALGGPHLAAAGATVRFPLERYTVMGFAELPARLPAHFRLLRRLRAEFRAGHYDLAVLLDYPGFNLRVAEAAHRHGVKALYYIAPKYWASGGERRVRRLAHAVDRLAVVLPFEAEFFTRHGLPAEYVGHPLLDRGPAPSRDAARARLGLAPEQRVLALFPGSRPQEVRRLWPPFREAAQRLLKEGRCDAVVVAGLGSAHYAGSERFLIQRDDSELVLAAADAALVKSGTGALEAALAGVPMVVAYRLHPLTAWLARRMITVPWISLVNLLAGRPVVEELVQADASAPRLVAAVARLLDPAGGEARRQREAFAALRERLGGPGAAERVAAIAAELLA